MPITCLVCKSFSTSSNKSSFHKFPKDELKRNKWIESLKLSDKNINFNTAYICNDHFDEECFYEQGALHTRSQLHIDAVPRLLNEVKPLSIVSEGYSKACNTFQDTNIDREINNQNGEPENEVLKVVRCLPSNLDKSSDISTSNTIDEICCKNTIQDRSNYNSETENNSSNSGKMKDSQDLIELTTKVRFMTAFNTEYICREDFVNDEAWYKFLRYTSYCRSIATPACGKNHRIDKKKIRSLKRIIDMLKKKDEFAAKSLKPKPDLQHTNRLKIEHPINLNIAPGVYGNPDDDNANICCVDIKTEPLEMTHDVEVKEEYVGDTEQDTSDQNYIGQSTRPDDSAESDNGGHYDIIPEPVQANCSKVKHLKDDMILEYNIPIVGWTDISHRTVEIEFDQTDLNYIARTPVIKQLKRAEPEKYLQSATSIKPRTGMKFEHSKNVITKLHSIQNSITTKQKADKSDEELPISVEPIQCDVCKKCFSKPCNLNAHLQLHTAERPFKCDICKKCFIRRDHLNNHMRVHTGEKPYKCVICEKCFSQRLHLNNHLRIHTGDKPYKCEVCEKCFRNKSDLTKHIRIHTGEKPYKCEVCEKGFSEKQNLTNHIRTHTGDKPYKCNVCEKCFSTRTAVRTHERIHTGVKPYKCDICMKSYTVKKHLNNHIRIHNSN